MNLILIALAMITINAITPAPLNSHQVNQTLTAHKTALETHDAADKSFKTKIADNKVHNDNALGLAKVGSEHETHLKSINTSLEAVKNASESEYAAKLAAYNALIQTYNTTKKDLYCPNLVELSLTKPLLPTDPKFHCMQIAELCSNYAGFTMLLQKIFDKDSATFAEDDYFKESKKANCLIDKIEKLFAPDSETDQLKVEMSFKAKCCTKAVTETVKLSFPAVSAVTDLSLLKKDLLSLTNHTNSLAEATKAIDASIAQIKSNIATPPTP